MAGPSWLAGVFAVAMIVIALYCAGRLVAARRWHRPTEADADGLHVAMGAAMAGMLLPRLSFLPGSAWEAVFALAAVWFAGQAVRASRSRAAACWQCPYPVAHLVECGAMLYMFLAASRAVSSGPAAGSPMPGMSGAGGSRLPAVAAVLALFMLGYVIWAADRLASMAARTTGSAGAPRPARDRVLVPVTSGVLAAAGPPDAAGIGTGSSAAAGWPQQLAAQRQQLAARPMQLAARPMVAPRLGACYKIAMGLAMCYMLVQML